MEATKVKKREIVNLLQIIFAEKTRVIYLHGFHDIFLPLQNLQ